MKLGIARSEDLSASELSALRGFLTEAFDGRFDDGNWANALGGTHVLVRDRGEIIAHASVVPRTMRFPEEHGWQTCQARTVGYVESVAVDHHLRRQGLGTQVLNTINDLISELHDGFGALATGQYSFYERAGWKKWTGPTYLFRPSGITRTPEGDQYLMVLVKDDVEVATPIACEWRAGDLW